MRWLVLAAALVQLLTPIFINPFGDEPSLAQSGPPSMIEPAGYAFIVWGVIYLSALAYAVWQLLPAGRAVPATATIAKFALVLYIACPLWLLAANFGPLWGTIPLALVLAACSITAMLLGERSAARGTRRWWIMVAPFAIYAGWTTCATFVNFAEVAPQFGFDRFGLSVATFGIVAIGLAALAAALVLFLTMGNVPYALTVAWALVAIIVAVMMRGDAPILAFAAGTGLLGLMLWTGYLRLIMPVARPS